MLHLGRPNHYDLDALTFLDYDERFTVVKESDTARRHGQVFRDSFQNFVSPRTTNIHVARVAQVTPDIDDIFYLRFLLHHKPARSFQLLRTHNGTTIYDAFPDTARAMGNDEEHEVCFRESSILGQEKSCATSCHAHC